MPTPYSNDLRQRVCAAHQKGLGPAELAERFGIAERTVNNWIKRFRATGTMAAKVWRRGRHSLLDGREDELRKLLRERDYTLDELRQRLGHQASRMAFWRTLRRMEFGVKKNAARGRTRPS